MYSGDPACSPQRLESCQGCGVRERPTASATSARDDTPSLANTLVRWPSTVFWERNSSSAISRLVASERDAIGDLELAAAERAEARALAEAALARADPLAEAAEVARGLVAVAVGLAGRERALRSGQQPDRLLAVARLRQRDAGKRPAARGRDRRVHRVRALGGRGAPARRPRPRRRRRASAASGHAAPTPRRAAARGPEPSPRRAPAIPRRRRGRRPRSSARASTV